MSRSPSIATNAKSRMKGICSNEETDAHHMQVKYRRGQKVMKKIALTQMGSEKEEKRNQRPLLK
jgi:hypothetical protein